jgi:hypothetical protein
MAESLSTSVAFAPRTVPTFRAFAWFESAMRLFKRAPRRWCLLGFITLTIKLLFEFTPSIGRAAAEVIVPVIECGLIIGAAQLERDGKLDLNCAWAAFRAPPAALAAIVVSSLIVSAVEFSFAYALAGVNLLADPDDPRITAGVALAVIGAGALASLPFVFVPPAALFQRAGFVGSFSASLRGFALNTTPLLLFGLISLGLAVVGLLTFWIGLIAVFPLLAAANYAAWKDVYSPPIQDIATGY